MFYYMKSILYFLIHILSQSPSLFIAISTSSSISWSLPKSSLTPRPTWSFKFYQKRRKQLLPRDKSWFSIPKFWSILSASISSIAAIWSGFIPIADFTLFTFNVDDQLDSIFLDKGFLDTRANLGWKFQLGIKIVTYP